MDQYLSRLIKHKFSIEAVHSKTSVASHSSQRICPKIQYLKRTDHVIQVKECHWNEPLDGPYLKPRQGTTARASSATSCNKSSFIRKMVTLRKPINVYFDLSNINLHYKNFSSGWSQFHKCVCMLRFTYPRSSFVSDKGMIRRPAKNEK